MKKLELKKQKIVDLSDQDASFIHGGSILDSFSAISELSDMYCGDYTHTGWSCGGCSIFGGDTVNCTACGCDTAYCQVRTEQYTICNCA